jgi:hypothetical protein
MRVCGRNSGVESLAWQHELQQFLVERPQLGLMLTRSVEDRNINEPHTFRESLCFPCELSGLNPNIVFAEAR